MDIYDPCVKDNYIMPQAEENLNVVYDFEVSAVSGSGNEVHAYNVWEDFYSNSIADDVCSLTTEFYYELDGDDPVYEGDWPAVFVNTGTEITINKDSLGDITSGVYVFYAYTYLSNYETTVSPLDEILFTMTVYDGCVAGNSIVFGENTYAASSDPIIDVFGKDEV